jgi:hypothetical protein
MLKMLTGSSGGADQEQAFSDCLVLGFGSCFSFLLTFLLTFFFFLDLLLLLLAGQLRMGRRAAAKEALTIRYPKEPCRQRSGLRAPLHRATLALGVGTGY